MNLDGPVVLWVAATLAALGVVGSAVLLPRTSRSTRGLAARLVTQVGVSGLVLLLAGVVLNDQYGFYTGWSDLFGQGGPQQVTASGEAAGRALQAHAAGSGSAGLTGPTGGALPALPDPGQRLQSFVVRGARSGLTGTVLVSLPTTYAEPSEATRTYPVIEAFQGYPGSPAMWMQDMDLVPTLDAMAAVGHAARTIVVSPQVEFPAGRDTECVDGGGEQPQVETWVSEDVPRFLAAHLRVRTDRASWATIGLSFGGWCAAMVTMLHPDLFGSAIVLSGYFEPDFGSSYRPFTATGSTGRRYDLVATAAKAPPPVALWMFTSKADGLSYPSSRALLHAARSPMSVTSVVQLDSGHRMSVWVAALPEALRWLTATSPGFAA